LSDTFDTTNREAYRPFYHFTPEYGWMNDPNGMVYKDGVYHLFYQYNPYGSMWGNMHWGHATTTDLVTWEHQPVALAPDVIGAIFSGSAIVDENNVAGFGKDAIVAFYTSAGDRQTQSIAYSLDNGKSFVKYAGNPVLTSPAPDFRDPKVFYHNESSKWIMILAVGQEMQLFSSDNLKEWAYESSFGEGEGAHGGVWECPDLIEVAVEGTNEKKWVLFCNINPGGPFGGSATQYFVGTFDGKKFVNESPALTKWMDYGKDHYATVTWSNAPEGRHIGIAWMSNWQYANDVPTMQFRSANSVPRDFSLFVSEGVTYLKSAPSKELLALRGKGEKAKSFKVNKTYNIDKLAVGSEGAFELEITIQNKDAEVIGLQLFNSKGEKVDMFYNLVEKTFSMDRTQSGLVEFSKEFPVVTVAPTEKTNELKLRLFVDKCSIEAFGNDGRFAMTNLVFPTEPYTRMSFYAKGGSYNVTSFQSYKLASKQQ
ncbi:MAG: glycoside hydrolase family 32 protein, partial [Phocaeicola sp.]